jgi:hypothetical protein
VQVPLACLSNVMVMLPIKVVIVQEGEYISPGHTSYDPTNCPNTYDPKLLIPKQFFFGLILLNFCINLCKLNFFTVSNFPDTGVSFSQVRGICGRVH